MIVQKRDFLVFVFVHVMMIFLLVDKQNVMIKALVELQRLEEKKDCLIQDKKELMLHVETLQQLSKIQIFAEQNLHMQPITLSEMKSVT